MSEFNKERVHNFFKVRFIESLNVPFHEEQLYFFYATCLLEFNDILADAKEYVVNSDNQVLISYYLKLNLFTKEDITKLKTYTTEDYWFQNYHLILYCPDLLSDIDSSILTYIIPQYCAPSPSESPLIKKRRQTYIRFYKQNLSAGNAFIRDIENVTQTICDYLDLRFQYEEELYSST